MNERILLRPSVLLPLPNRAALLQHLSLNHEKASLWVPGFLERSAGQTVDVEIALAEERMLFHCRGVVRWKRMRGQPGLPAAIGIELLPEHGHTGDLLFGFANGTAEPLAQRRHRRFPAVLPAFFIMGTERIAATTVDISKNGACLESKSSELPETGKPVALRIELPGPAVSFELDVMVRWRKLQPRPQFGVQFQADSDTAKALVTTLIGAIKRQASGR